MQDIDIRPGLGLFLTLYGALKRRYSANPSLEEQSKDKKDRHLSIELVNCFDPQSYLFTEFKISLEYQYHEVLGEGITAFTIKDDKMGGGTDLISLDISDPNVTLETLWGNLLRKMAMSHKETLINISETEDNILERNTSSQTFLLGGKHRFKEKEQNLYRGLIAGLTN